MPRFGSHLSIAGGLENACTAARTLGLDALQIFVKNQRQWRAKPLTVDQVESFLRARDDAGLRVVVAHASYLLNLASPDPALRGKSIRAMIDELDRCEALQVAYLVFHPGAHMGKGVNKGVTRVARSLNEVLRRRPESRTKILLETTAGQGTALGWRFEHLGAILERVERSDRLGLCLDTCHLFAAGYDFRKPMGYRDMMAELDDRVGLSTVRCVHLNDSRRELGSRVDRHDHIGKGKIGKAAFAHFVNDPCLAGLPMILETPKGRDGRGTDLDRVNLKRLRSLINREPDSSPET